MANAQIMRCQPSFSLYLALRICSLHTKDDIQESSFCTAHNLFSQLSSRQVTSEPRLGSHYHPFSGSHAQHANEPEALHLSRGAKTGHPRQMDGDGWGIAAQGLGSTLNQEHCHALRNCYLCNCRVLDLL